MRKRDREVYWVRRVRHLADIRTTALEAMFEVVLKKARSARLSDRERDGWTVLAFAVEQEIRFRRPRRYPRIVTNIMNGPRHPQRRVLPKRSSTRG